MPLFLFCGEKIYELSGKSIAEYKYNEMGQVAEKKITDRDIGEIKTGYEYDKRGRTSAIITQMGREEIEYDKAGRIIGKRNTHITKEDIMRVIAEVRDTTGKTATGVLFLLRIA